MSGSKLHLKSCVLPGVFIILVSLALTLRTPDPDLLYQEALGQVESGRFQDARSTLSRLKRVRQPTTLDHGLQARIEIADGRVDQALIELAAIPDDHALASWARLRQGQLERGRFRFRIAEGFLRDAIRLDDRLAEPRRELIYILGMQLRRADLHDQFRVLSLSAPLSAREIYVWCLVRDLAWWEGAEQVPILEKAVIADPADDRSRAALAEILNRQSETDRAIRLLNQDTTGSLFVLARKLEILIERDGTESAREILMKRPKNEPVLALIRGRLAMHDGDAFEATRCFEIARKAEPGRRQVIAESGHALTAVNQIERGKAFTEWAGRIDALNNLLLKMEKTVESSGPEKWIELAEACERAGRLHEARAWYGVILRKSPLDEAAQASIYRIDRTPSQDDAFK